MDEKQMFYTLREVQYEELAGQIENLANLTKEGKKNHWVYRGQSSAWELESTLERYCKMSRYPLTDAPGIETEMIRNFKRLYNGEDRRDVEEDTLYCISLMRHYGAPSRILDFTYSKDIATYFGLECAFETVPLKEDKTPDYDAKRSLAVWCIDPVELIAQIKKEQAQEFERKRINDKDRNDDTFMPLYMENKYDLVTSTNPLRLHQRLDIQHGVFLCPGNVGISFMDNLSRLYGGENKGGVFKFTCEIDPRDLREELERFRLRNITRQSLLPGLDGFAQSMKYKLESFKDIFESREEAKVSRNASS